jgi:dTDP-4-amino-4,6-dideoxygalactose transaminase
MTKDKEHSLIKIPHSRPTLGAKEIKAVSDVISSGYVAEGAVVQKFEQSFADYLNIRHAVATNSGTSALHLALLALNVGPGDEVIIPSYVCCALLNAVNYTGATPILADIYPETYNLDAADVKKHLSNPGCPTHRGLCPGSGVRICSVPGGHFWGCGHIFILCYQND